MFGIFKYFSKEEKKDESLVTGFSDFLGFFGLLYIRNCAESVASAIAAEFLRIAFTHVPDTEEERLNVEQEIYRLKMAELIYNAAIERGKKNPASIYWAARNEKYYNTRATNAEKRFILDFNNQSLRTDCADQDRNCSRSLTH